MDPQEQEQEAQQQQNEHEAIVVIDGVVYSSSRDKFQLHRTALAEPSQHLRRVPHIDSAGPLPRHLSASRTVVIDSIKSGVGRDAENDVYTQLVAPLLDALAVKHEYIRTESPSHIRELGAALSVGAPGSGDLCVVMLSGDTSIGEFINGIDDASCEARGKDRGSTRRLFVANIASGTGNAMLASAGVTSVLQSVSGLFRDAHHPMAVHSVRFANCNVVQGWRQVDFVAVFSWAFHSALVADSDTPEMRKLGISRFAIAARENLERVQSYPAAVRDAHGHVITPNASHSYLVFTALSNFEPSFKISPLANLRDLYMCEVGDDVQHDDLMKVMGAAYKEGAHIHDPHVNYTKLQTPVTLSIPASVDAGKLRFCVDGSIVTLEKLDGCDIEIEISDKRFQSWDVQMVGTPAPNPAS